MKIETARIDFEWRPPRSKAQKANPRLAAARCWNNPFYYGDGSPATERSVIIRRRDFMKLMKLARVADSANEGKT